MAVTWLFKNFFQTLYFVHLKRFHISVVWHFILQSYLKNCNVNVVIVTMFWFRDKCLSPWIGKLKDFEMPNNWKSLCVLLPSGCIDTKEKTLFHFYHHQSDKRWCHFSKRVFDWMMPKVLILGSWAIVHSRYLWMFDDNHSFIHYCI